MRLTKREGLVIRKSDFSDADRIITVFTKEKGKESFVAKGIRKSQKRERIATDLLVVSSFVIYEKTEEKEERTLPIISSVEVLDYFPGLRSDLEVAGIAMYILKFLDFVINENEKNDKLYKLTIDTLKYFDTKKESLEKKIVVILYYLITVIKIEGIMFDIEDGYFFTIEESKIDRNGSDKSIKISQVQKNILSLINNIDINGINKLELRQSEVLGLVSIVEKYIFFHMGVYLSLKEVIVN